MIFLNLFPPAPLLSSSILPLFYSPSLSSTYCPPSLFSLFLNPFTIILNLLFRRQPFFSLPYSSHSPLLPSSLSPSLSSTYCPPSLFSLFINPFTLLLNLLFRHQSLSSLPHSSYTPCYSLPPSLPHSHQPTLLAHSFLYS